MRKYKIRISATAEKSLKKIQKKDQSKIVKEIIKLADDPIPAGSRKLTGYDDVFRIRVGKYRIVYSIAKKIITIICQTNTAKYEMR